MYVSLLALFHLREAGMLSYFLASELRMEILDLSCLRSCDECLSLSLSRLRSRLLLSRLNERLFLFGTGLSRDAFLESFASSLKSNLMGACLRLEGVNDSLWRSL